VKRIIAICILILFLWAQNSYGDYWRGAGDGVATGGVLSMQTNYTLHGFYPDRVAASNACGVGCTPGSSEAARLTCCGAWNSYYSGGRFYCYPGGTTNYFAWDHDHDGVIDDNDQCPDTTEGESVDSAGCSCSQKGLVDIDNDGICDDNDQCPDTPEGEVVDAAGCSCSQKSLADTDGDGIGDVCDDCSLALSTDRARLVSGDIAIVTVDTDPGDMAITWSASTENGDATVEWSADSSGKSITITDVSGEGTIIIHAENTSNPDCADEIKIEIGGCEPCIGDVCRLPGSGRVKLKSIDVRLSLGNSFRGKSAGSIFLQPDAPDPANATPQILEAYDFGPDLKIIKSGDNLRQVVAPEAFTDIVVIDAYSYNIFFYTPDALGSKDGGVYEIVPGSVPFVTWKIENPDASPTVFNRLKITEIRDTVTKVYEYIWDETESTWSLSKGNGLQVLTKKEEIIAGNRVETKIVKDNLGTVASKVKTTYKAITYGSETREVIIERIIDPDGDALTTTKNYYEEPSCPAGSCGRIESQVNPDGSWIRYEYDSDGRKTAEISSWLNAPAGSPASSARALSYDYNPLSGDSNATEDERRPRTVTEEILGNVVAKTYYVYQVDGSSGDRTEIVERCTDPSATYGDANNQRTVTVTYAYGTDLAESGLIKSMAYPDSRLDSYAYEYGIYTPDADPAVPGTFSSGEGEDIRQTVIHGTVGQPSGIVNKTTREISISNQFGRELLHEIQVYTGSDYERIQWTVKLYDDEGHVTDVYNSDGTHTETDWGCCNKQSETDAQGIVTDYTLHDDLGRVLEQIKRGTAGTADIITEYTYDAQGRRLSQTVTAGELILTSAGDFDLAGRVIQSEDTAGLVTGFDYAQGGKVTTVTLPGGATEIAARYMGGRTKSITGSGVIPKYYTYGVNADGTQWIRVDTVSETSPMWEKTTVDMLGRTLSIEKPGYTGTETTQFLYDANGRLEKTITPGQADTLVEYDELGNQTRSGLDINANGSLDLTSTDRITEKETAYAKLGSDWWQQTVQKVYATDNNGTTTTVYTQRIQISGLGTGGKTGETVSIDIHGNQTTEQVFIDRANKTKTRIIDYPDATFNGESVNVNGLLTSSQNKSGILTTYEYDDFGRRTGVIDPRTGTSITHYNAKEQVDYIEDPVQNRTTYTYDPVTGRKVTETNAIGRVSRYAYNDRGQVTYIWGDAAEPVKYVYDSYGRMSEMHTFRSGTGWEGISWPTGTTGDADITTWHYQESTGLLTSKEYADNKIFSYFYTLGGKLDTRSWSRTVGGIPLETTYSYDPQANELLTIDYSDTTPDITFTYDRLGRQKIVIDAAGTRTFAYKSDTLQLDSETISGLHNRVITHTYETSGVIGRDTGFTIESEYSAVYGYEANTGRFNSIAWNAGGTSNAATYTYVSNFDLLYQLTTDNGQLTTYQHEPNRNLKTQVKNEFNTQLISKYDYQYNELGLRDSVEITSDWQATLNSKTSTYTPNALNQYTEITTTNGQQTTDTFTYDDDGNLTLKTTDGSGPKYTYNAENRLISVEPQTPTDGDTKVEFLYDYMGRRVQKKVYTYQATSYELSATTLFVYDGWNLIQELYGTGAVRKSYVWGLDLSQSLQEAGGIGGLIAAVDDSTSAMYYYQYDANGNVTELVDASDGSIAAHYEYDPYGNLVFSTGAETDNNPFRFSTKYFDQETNLYYYGYRYYSSQLGRWLTRDPMGEEGGLNLYNFADLNPINAIDPFGLIDDFIRDWTGQNANDYIGSAWAHDVKVVQYTNWWNQRQTEIHKRLAQDFEDLSNRERSMLRVMDPIPPSNDPVGWYILFVQMYHQYRADYWQIKAMKEWEFYKYYSNILPLQPQISTDDWGPYGLETCEN